MGLIRVVTEIVPCAYVLVVGLPSSRGAQRRPPRILADVSGAKKTGQQELASEGTPVIVAAPSTGGPDVAQ